MNEALLDFAAAAWLVTVVALMVSHELPGAWARTTRRALLPVALLLACGCVARVASVYGPLVLGGR